MGSATFKYAFKKRDFAEVELQINRGFANTVVRYHESEVGTIPTRAQLADGASYNLPNGGRLHITLPNGKFPPRVLLNDTPLVQTWDPPSSVRAAATMLVIIGTLQMIALIYFVMKEQIALSIFAVIPLALAIGYLLLSFPVRHRSNAAAYAAIAMLALDTCLFVAPFPPNTPLAVMIGGVAIRLIALKALTHGIGAMAKINNREATQVACASMRANET